MEEDKAQKSGEKFRKAQALVVEILNLNPQDEDATKVFKLWKRKLDNYLPSNDLTILLFLSSTFSELCF